MANTDRGLSVTEDLEVRLNNELTDIPMFKSAELMNDGTLLVIRINNSSKSQNYSNDYIECAKRIKSIVPEMMPTYKPWLEFDHGLPRDFITFIFVNNRG